MKSYTSIEHFKDFLGEEWEIHQHQRMDLDYKFTFCTTVIVDDIDAGTLVKKFVGALERCPLVKDSWRELKDEISKLKLEKEHQRLEIARLKVFEDHYNLNFKMAHGKGLV